MTKTKIDDLAKDAEDMSAEEQQAAKGGLSASMVTGAAIGGLPQIGGLTPMPIVPSTGALASPQPSARIDTRPPTMMQAPSQGPATAGLSPIASSIKK